ncbi:MAG: choice-of-anchor P family protein [Egibacteraceae bacterium]
MGSYPWRIVAAVAVALMAVSLLPLVGLAQEPVDDPNDACPDEVNPPAPFTDRLQIPEVHRLNVDCAYNNDIALGFADRSFRPSTQVQRDQFASFMVRTLRAADVDLPPASDQGFTDISGNVHEDNINILAATGITAGTTSTTYSPSLPLRRDQIASFILRAASFIEDVPLENLQRDSGPFTDVPASNVHARNINGAQALNLTIGRTASTYDPATSTRRDQMASFLVRLLAALREGSLIPAEDRAQTLDLTPATATNAVGTEHTVTATVRDDEEALLADANVRFEVYRDTGAGVFSGPVAQEEQRTGDDGESSFTYTGPGDPASDVIVACPVRPGETCEVVDTDAETDGIQFTGDPDADARVSDTATKTWQEGATPTSPADSLTASAFGLDVNLLGVEVLDEEPSVAIALPEPRQAEETDEVLGGLPLQPLVEAEVIEVFARGDLDLGFAQGEAAVTDLEILSGDPLDEEPLVTADAIRTISTSTCPDEGTFEEAMEGSQFVNVTVAGVELPLDPPPNTNIVIPGVAEVWINEVIPDEAGEGHGFTVRGLRVDLLDSEGADIVVAEAHSSVICADAEA